MTKKRGREKTSVLKVYGTKLSPVEAETVKANAAKWANGNLSEWLRRAAIEYVPPVKKVEDDFY